MSSNVVIFTDGSSSPHSIDHPGGWCAILMTNTHIRIMAGWVDRTTNNQMEIMSAMRGLNALKHACNVTLYSDSQYVIQTMLGAFKKKKNIEWWKDLESAAKRHTIEWKHQKGHGSLRSQNELVRWNNEADHYAVLARASKSEFDIIMLRSEYQFKAGKYGEKEN